MEKLKGLIKKLEIDLQYANVLNPGISKSPVGWHIEHILLTTNLIIDTIEKSNPLKYKNKFSLAKLFVFTTKKIPRGRVQAPNSVRPKDSFEIRDIEIKFKTCYHLISKLSSLNKNSYFEHPFFGHLNLKATVKFLEIHTKHHLYIIEDIVKSVNA